MTSWKKLQGRLQSISVILTQPRWVDIYFICTYEEWPVHPMYPPPLSPLHKTDHAEALEFIVAS